MPKGLSPTQRTLKELRRLGRTVEVVEKWQINPKHPAGGFRKDLFGFIDLIALDPERGIVGIQSCGNSFSSHNKKILNSECTENAIEWLKCGGKLELWAWRKILKKRGGKLKIWSPRIKEYSEDDFI